MKDCILVTGASGFVGSHLVERLLEEGRRVRAFVRYTSQLRPGWLSYVSADKCQQLEIITGDLRDAEAVAEAARGVQSIFHLGAVISIPYSYTHPREVVETNILGTLAVLGAARTHAVGRLVYVSTSEVYGTAQYMPIDEKHLLQGQSPYAASKIGAEKLVESFHITYGLPAVLIRPFNMYGPRQSARAVIPTIITQAITTGRVSLGNTSTTRDFTYVLDTVEALIRAADTDAAIGKTLNVGSNSEVSIAEIARIIAHLAGREIDIVCEEARLRPEKSEVRQLRADNTLARDILGWQPTTSLYTGLQQTIQWVAANLDKYRVGAYEV